MVWLQIQVCSPDGEKQSLKVRRSDDVATLRALVTQMNDSADWTQVRASWGGVRVQRACHAHVLVRMPSSETLSTPGACRVFLGALVSEIAKHCPTVPLAPYEFPALQQAGRSYLTESVYNVVLQKSIAPQIRQLILYYYQYE